MARGGRFRGFVAGAAALALLAAGCGSDGTDRVSVSGAPATSAPASDDASTTTVPPTEPGALLSAEPLDLGPGLVAYRVLYRSQSVAGDPIEVSGLVLAPDGQATAADRPVMAVAHGTVGLGDACAPSTVLDDRLLGFGRELVEAGFVVAATDYEGLGTPGLHPYIVGESEARSVVDSVRAARQIEGLGASDQVVVWGHSQGGHAALHTGQLWEQLAPELELLGVAAGAPPSQFDLLAEFLRGSPFQGYIVMVAAGLAAAYPELDLSAALTEEAMAGLDVLEEGCTREIFEVYNPLPYERIAQVEDIFAEPGWGERLRENDPNRAPVPVPLLILHGGDDEQIPTASSALLQQQLCDLGSEAVERRVYDGASHSGAVDEYFDEVVEWALDRVAGEPATNQCP